MNDFGDWLAQSLKDNGWSMSELGRRCGVTHTTISRIINGERKPSDQLYDRLARALRVTPEGIRRRAGILPPSPPKTIRLSEPLRLFASLTESEQESMLIQMKALADEEARKREQERERERAARLTPATAGAGAM